MGKSNSLPKAKPCPMIGQITRMSSKHPQLKLKMRRNAAIWEGEWCPSALSDKYLIRVTYNYRLRPVIAVLSPILRLAKEKVKLPHTYTRHSGTVGTAAKSSHGR